MLTPKQNMLEVIKGGNPDRFVNQYEAVQLLFHPFMFTNPLLQPGQENVVNAWGVTNTFPKGVPGSFPVHTPDKIVVKDIEDWKDYVHAPSLKFTQDQWDMVKALENSVGTQNIHTESLDSQSFSKLRDQVCKNIVEDESHDQASQHIRQEIKCFNRIFEFNLCI